MKFHFIGICELTFIKLKKAINIFHIIVNIIMVKYLLFIIESIGLIYLVFNIFYITIYSIGALFYKRTKFNISVVKNNKFAVLIPAYKSDEIILNTAQKSLLQSYDKKYFDIIVIGDSFLESTLDKLNELDIKLFSVQFEVSTKAKSLNTALALLPETYDYCCVLDVDNIMEYDFLSKINFRLQNNEMVVQAHRVAKNTNTSFAILDALSEEINNNIFRKGHIGLGVSSALIGSGFAIQYKYFKDILLNIESPVEDKELEIILLRENHKILYESDAYVYDEKVASSSVFFNQRKRWIASQFYDFNKVFFNCIVELVINKNFNFFDKAMQKILLPRVLLLAVSALSTLTIFFTTFYYGTIFIILFLFCCLSFFLGIPSKYYNMKTIKASLSVPKAIILMVFALLKSKGAANKKFIHTKHEFLDEIEKNNNNEKN
jgi:cellulose synthase/poly-beta-1,6-N-acetylglucosamine synthase-like glycosyltransferase